MARRKPASPQGIEQQVQEFESESPQQTLPEPPRNLGNFPDELDRHPAMQAQVAAAEPTEPDDEPSESAAPAPSVPEAGDEESSSAAPPADDRLAELERRLAARDQELQFLRLQQQQQGQAIQQTMAPPPGPIEQIDAMLGGYRITPQDWEQAVADPQKGAEYAMNLLRAAAAVGANLALDRARTEYAQAQTQQGETQQLAQLFYGRHPDLVPQANYVAYRAQQIRQAEPWRNAEQLVDATAAAVRQELGLSSTRRAADPAKRRRVTVGEMGGGRANGHAALSPLERQLRQFEAEGTYLGRG